MREVHRLEDLEETGLHDDVSRYCWPPISRILQAGIQYIGNNINDGSRVHSTWKPFDNFNRIVRPLHLPAPMHPSSIEKEVEGSRVRGLMVQS